MLVRGGVAYDMARVAPTVAELAACYGDGDGDTLDDWQPLDTLDLPLLAPIDLQRQRWRA